MTEPNVTNDKHELWIRDSLIPLVVNKERTARPTKKINLKSSTVKKFLNDGGYIVTLCYKVVIVLNVDDADERISFFVKIAPELRKEDYEMAGFKQKFLNETIAYEDLLPSLGSPEDFPKFYYSKTDPTSATIAISDFSEEGFSMSKACVNLSLDHILESMKALGKFHGASFALKYTDRTRFDTLWKKIGISVLENRLHPLHEETIKNGVRRALKHFRESPDAAKVPEVFLQKLEHVMCEDDNLYEYMRSRANPVEPMAVICHGDFLRNNVAFAYDTNGLATKAMLFDFQTVLYTTPMLDVCLFMANSTSHDTRKKHFDQIFRTYHDAVIAHFLDRTALSVDDLPDYMSYDAFLREYAIQMPYAFCIAAYFVAVLIQPTDLLAIENFENMPKSIFTLGGDVIDHETHAQILEMYEMHRKFNLKLLDGA